MFIDTDHSKKFMAQLEALGMDRLTAVSIMCAVEHAAQCKEFAAQYGQFQVRALTAWQTPCNTA